MPNEVNTAAVAEIKEKLNGSQSVIMADYRGLSVKEMQEFRAKVRESGGEVKVYKNTLTEIAIRELAMPSMDEFLEGPTCFIFGSDASFTNSGSSHNPIIIGVDNLFQIGIGHDSFRKIRPGSKNMC